MEVEKIGSINKQEVYQKTHRNITEKSTESKAVILKYYLDRPLAKLIQWKK